MGNELDREMFLSVTNAKAEQAIRDGRTHDLQEISKLVQERCPGHAHMTASKSAALKGILPLPLEQLLKELELGLK